MQLRELTAGDEEAFFEGLKHWDEAQRAWYTFDWRPGISYAEMLATLRKNSQGIDLRAGFVPSTMFYGFVTSGTGGPDSIVGRVHVRHQLNDFLRTCGGNVGYAVAPPFRRRGYATEMFRQALPLCRERGLSRILVTCGDDNLASKAIIERFGGKLEDRRWDEKDQEMVCRYWISLP